MPFLADQLKRGKDLGLGLLDSMRVTAVGSGKSTETSSFGHYLVVLGQGALSTAVNSITALEGAPGAAPFSSPVR